MPQPALVSLNWRVQRQVRCSETGARAASVLGKRHYVSRSLDTNARRSHAVSTAPVQSAREAA
jgi:hypothetical protein